MTLGRIPNPLATDWEDTFDSIKSTPGAFGNIFVAATRQVRLVDAFAMALVVAGWGWTVLGLTLGDGPAIGLHLLGILPTLLWFAAGIAGGLTFEIGGIGVRSLVYWESYLLIALFACFGTISLRIALNPNDRNVYRSSVKPEA
jgi:hypothetical protein